MTEEEREFVIKAALGDNPLAKILRAIVSQIEGRPLTNEEWREWLENAI